MKKVLLIGNASYLNRGCEAITRGTVTILKKYLGECEFVCASSFESEKEFKDQINNEFDKDITHISINNLYKIGNKYSLSWIKHIIRYNLIGRINKDYRFKYLYENVISIDQYDCIVCVGGDNYSLDYGYPYFYTNFADYVISKNKKIYLWGASVGPFSNDKEFEEFISGHLNKYNKIFVRENKSLTYLKSIGVEKNVVQIMDPAFVMEPKRPNNKIIERFIKENSIGFNISPLMTKYITDGNIEEYIDINVEIVNRLIEETGKNIYLIPHVTVENADDYTVLKRLYDKVKNKEKVTLIEKSLNAAELKWVIGKLEVFVGARTHATIAGFSQGIPTISLVYSMKAIGINIELFGDTEYCINPNEYNIEKIVDIVKYSLENRERISSDLLDKMINIKLEAFKAGEILHESLGRV